jgi:prepilin-type N-terminal cleavage/methylation domain-containing protein
MLATALIAIAWAHGRRQVPASRSAGPRRGFTFFELLLVLAIFMVIAAMASPFLLRTFNAQALRGGADQVRAAFDRARVLAIRTGNVYAFLYQPTAELYTVTPLTNAYSLVQSPADAASPENSTFKKLPSGLQFAGSSVSDDARAQFESENSTLDSAGMTPILFYPDGTAQDAYLLITHPQGDQIRIHLRGLTGLSSAERVEKDQ